MGRSRAKAPGGQGRHCRRSRRCRRRGGSCARVKGATSADIGAAAACHPPDRRVAFPRHPYSGVPKTTFQKTWPWRARTGNYLRRHGPRWQSRVHRRPAHRGAPASVGAPTTGRRRRQKRDGGSGGPCLGRSKAERPRATRDPLAGQSVCMVVQSTRPLLLRPPLAGHRQGEVPPTVCSTPSVACANSHHCGSRINGEKRDKSGRATSPPLRQPHHTTCRGLTARAAPSQPPNAACQTTAAPAGQNATHTTPHHPPLLPPPAHPRAPPSRTPPSRPATRRQTRTVHQRKPP